MKDEKTGDDLVSIGFVVDLDYADATTSAHDLLQQFKLHPLVRGILEGGERVAWGAKALPGGGYWSMPKLSMPGALLVGDAGGMVDTAALKGVHHCIKSGMLAAEAIYASLQARRARSSPTSRRSRSRRSARSSTRCATPASRSRRASSRAARSSGASIMTKGKIPRGRCRGTATTSEPLFVGDTKRRLSQARRQVHLRQALDRSTSPATRPATTRRTTSGCSSNVPREIAESWVWMCPAGVYEIPDDAPDDGEVDVIVNYTNCVQCGAITAKGGRLTPPEGGDGPLYQIT